MYGLRSMIAAMSESFTLKRERMPTEAGPRDQQPVADIVQCGRRSLKPLSHNRLDA